MERLFGRGPEPVARGGSSVIKFDDYQGTYAGTGRGNRVWRITRTVTGWRLKFRDPGDPEWTYAGTHATLFAAQREAGR